MLSGWSSILSAVRTRSGHPFAEGSECRLPRHVAGSGRHRAVTLKGPSGRNDSMSSPRPAECLVPSEGQFRIREVAPLRLDLGDPRGLVIENQRDGACQVLGSGPWHTRTRARPGAASEPPGESVLVGAVQAGMHLLLGEGGLPPPEITDDLRAMGEGLPRPEAHHAGVRTGFHGAQFTGPGCCSITQNRPPPTPR